MIRIEQITNKRHNCISCGRETPLTMRVFINSLELDLCEDCSSALSWLHRLCMEEGKPFLYDKDEIKEIK